MVERRWYTLFLSAEYYWKAVGKRRDAAFPRVVVCVFPLKHEKLALL